MPACVAAEIDHVFLPKKIINLLAFPTISLLFDAATALDTNLLFCLQSLREGHKVYQNNLGIAPWSNEPYHRKEAASTEI